MFDGTSRGYARDAAALRDAPDDVYARCLIRALYVAPLRAIDISRFIFILSADAISTF